VLSPVIVRVPSTFANMNISRMSSDVVGNRVFAGGQRSSGSSGSVRGSGAGSAGVRAVDVGVRASGDRNRVIHGNREPR